MPTYCPFRRNASTINSFKQAIYGCLQVNNQIWRWRVNRHLVVDLVIEFVFIGIEIDLSEQRIFIKEQVSDSERSKEILLLKVVNFLNALKEEK